MSATTTVAVEIDNGDAETIAEAMSFAIEQTVAKATAAELREDALGVMHFRARTHRLRTIRDAMVRAAETPENEMVTVR